LIIIRALLVTSRPDPLFPPDNNVFQVADTTFHYKAFFAELPIADFEHSNWHLFHLVLLDHSIGVLRVFCEHTCSIPAGRFGDYIGKYLNYGSRWGLFLGISVAAFWNYAAMFMNSFFRNGVDASGAPAPSQRPAHRLAASLLHRPGHSGATLRRLHETSR
jgi:hypothetical protein